MNEIDNELIIFIMENPCSYKDEIFQDFNKERRLQGRIPINQKMTMFL